ncbi:hypothetical protein F5Y15DRAFT_427402 [Xylariaceae sp. FL0016]|nr:hypothetical protein F5Y15DRAFT_427402 [Xylariaceae sp. FL0016]
MPLPSLSPNPTRHPNLCLSISRPLFAKLRSLLPPHSPSVLTTLLSIGCGSGLLEALLQAYLQDTNTTAAIVGVEVLSASVPHLPPDRVRRVKGTWDVVTDAAAAADAWMWAYPREPRLVRCYLDKFGLRRRRVGGDDGQQQQQQQLEAAGDAETSRSRVRRVIWLGPRVDWGDYEGVLRDSVFGENIEVFCGSEAGLAEEEMMAVGTRD